MQILDWQPYTSMQQAGLLPAVWMDWLRDPGSFMERLKRHGVLDPLVRVLSEASLTVSPGESALLGVRADEAVLVREVLIQSSYASWMYARTLIPATTLAHKTELTTLDTRSLGSVLFQDPTLRRSAFEIARIYPETHWHAHIESVANPNDDAFWARRSVFHVQEQPLLLTEVFLPDIETLAR